MASVMRRSAAASGIPRFRATGLAATLASCMSFSMRCSPLIPSWTKSRAVGSDFDCFFERGIRNLLYDHQRRHQIFTAELFGQRALDESYCTTKMFGDLGIDVVAL